MEVSVEQACSVSLAQVSTLAERQEFVAMVNVQQMVRATCLEVMGAPPSQLAEEREREEREGELSTDERGVRSASALETRTASVRPRSSVELCTSKQSRESVVRGAWPRSHSSLARK